MYQINAIEGLGQSVAATASSVTKATVPDFGAMLTSGIDTLNQNIAVAEQSLNAYALGDSLSTHDLMVAMEKARFSLQVAVEVRNRLVEVYGELTRMQV